MGAEQVRECDTKNEVWQKVSRPRPMPWPSGPIRVSCPARAKFYSKRKFASLQCHKRSRFALLTALLPWKPLRNRFQNPMFSHGFRAYSKFLFSRGKRPTMCNRPLPLTPTSKRPAPSASRPRSRMPSLSEIIRHNTYKTQRIDMVGIFGTVFGRIVRVDCLN
jgi:hypothetical protein